MWKAEDGEETRPFRLWHRATDRTCQFNGFVESQELFSGEGSSSESSTVFPLVCVLPRGTYSQLRRLVMQECDRLHFTERTGLRIPDPSIGEDWIYRVEIWIAGKKHVVPIGPDNAIAQSIRRLEEPIRRMHSLQSEFSQSTVVPS